MTYKSIVHNCKGESSIMLQNWGDKYQKGLSNSLSFKWPDNIMAKLTNKTNENQKTNFNIVFHTKIQNVTIRIKQYKPHHKLLGIAVVPEVLSDRVSHMTFVELFP